MKIFVTYRPIRERNYIPAWVAKTGNLITTSTVSQEEVVKKHKRKLEKMGIVNPIVVVNYRI